MDTKLYINYALAVICIGVAAITSIVTFNYYDAQSIAKSWLLIVVLLSWFVPPLMFAWFVYKHRISGFSNLLFWYGAFYGLPFMLKYLVFFLMSSLVYQFWHEPTFGEDEFYTLVMTLWLLSGSASFISSFAPLVYLSSAMKRSQNTGAGVGGLVIKPVDESNNSISSNGHVSVLLQIVGVFSFVVFLWALFLFIVLVTVSLFLKV